MSADRFGIIPTKSDSVSSRLPEQYICCKQVKASFKWFNIVTNKLYQLIFGSKRAAWVGDAVVLIQAKIYRLHNS